MTAIRLERAVHHHEQSKRNARCKDNPQTSHLHAGARMQQAEALEAHLQLVTAVFQRLAEATEMIAHPCTQHPSLPCTSLMRILHLSRDKPYELPHTSSTMCCTPSCSALLHDNDNYSSTALRQSPQKEPTDSAHKKSPQTEPSDRALRMSPQNEPSDKAHRQSPQTEPSERALR